MLHHVWPNPHRTLRDLDRHDDAAFAIGSANIVVVHREGALKLLVEFIAFHAYFDVLLLPLW